MITTSRPYYKIFYIIIVLLALIQSDGFTQFPSKLDTIRETTIEPYRDICFLRIIRKKIFKKVPFVSTGFFIAPNVIITAAHNIHSVGSSKVFSIEIVPGKYFEDRPFKTFIIDGVEDCKKAIKTNSNYSFSDNWKRRVKWDFGVITLPPNLVTANAAFKYSNAFVLDSTYMLNSGDTLNVAGYPADDVFGYNGDFITTQKDTCASTEEKIFRHHLATFTGNSGSPIWININGKRVVVGVHTFKSTATRLDFENYRTLMQWINSGNKVLNKVQ